MAFSGYKLAVAVMVVDQENHVLLVKGRQRGWEFPGGYVAAGESIAHAAIREVKEESGVDIDLTRLCGIEQDIELSTCVVLFEGKPISGALALSDESLDVGYFTIEEALNKITVQTFKERIIRCFHTNKPPFVVEI
ncbi:NUDIX hydrolase [Brevibacillus sp. SYP-B805]|uniref:NUDIX hydrolase n=1 Tax=Brevibacillus sp. SYP-B805 TaxID=1578199 RepID=UPI0013EBB46F|nr:NUDIX hydrolase [Brevibacillus sp. SYP-B805]NGQ93623.1 NUDIX hydrolase [Brevibacillus sp. SYP-B805]